MRNIALAAVAAFAGFSAIKGLVSTIAEFEDLRLALQTLEGSAEGARRKFEEIKTLAESLPFSVKTLTNATLQLGNAGFANATELMTLFSDAALATTDRLQVFEALVRLTARTTGGGLGLPQLEIVTDKVGGSMQELTRRLGITRTGIGKMGQSAVGATKIMTTLFDILRERFGGASERALDSLSLAFNNLGDAVDASRDRIGTQGFGAALTETVKLLSDLVSGSTGLSDVFGTILTTAVEGVGAAFKFMNENVALTEGTIAAIATLIALRLIPTIISATIAMGAFTLALLTNPVTLFAAAIALVVGSLIAFRDESIQVGNTTATISETFRALANVIGDTLSSAIDFVRTKLGGFGISFSDIALAAKGAINGIISLFFTLGGVIAIITERLITAFIKTFGKIVDLAFAAGEDIFDALTFGEGGAFAAELEKGLTTGLGELGPKLAKFIRENAGRDFIGELADIGTAAGKALVDSLEDEVKRVQLADLLAAREFIPSRKPDRTKTPQQLTKTTIDPKVQQSIDALTDELDLRERLIGLTTEQVEAERLLIRIKALEKSTGVDIDEGSILAQLKNVQKLEAEFENLQILAQGFQDAMKDVFETILTDGEFSADALIEVFSRAFASIAAQAAAEELTSALFGAAAPSSDFGGGGFGGLISSTGSFLAGLFHKGGVVTDTPNATRSVPAAVFAEVDSFRQGGFPGLLKPGEVPAILDIGEEVLTRGDPRNARNRGRPTGPSNVNITINAKDGPSVLRSRSEIERMLLITTRKGQRTQI